MNYKLVKITSYYRDFLTYYYTRHPLIGQENYEDQYKHLMQQRFAWSDAYAIAFQQLGNEAFEIVANARPLQEKWCREHSIQPGTDQEIIIEQLKKIKPEIVWLQDSYSFNGEFVIKLKEQVPSIKLTIGNCCSPITPKYYNDFKVFDLIVVCAPYFKQLLESNGLPECLVIPHAFDERILNEVDTNAQTNHDFLFSGSLILDQQFHQERIHFLEELIKSKVDINLLINLNQQSSKGLIFKQAGYVVSRIFDKVGAGLLNQKINGLRKVSKLEFFPSSSKVAVALSSRIKPPVFGLQMFQEIANSKIAFNIHGDIAANFAANMRMYEVTGMNTCLLTDWKQDINNYFKDEEEIVTYKSLDDAREKIGWLINHPDEMKAISYKGQQRTLTDHTFINRAKIIDSTINKFLKKK